MKEKIISALVGLLIVGFIIFSMFSNQTESSYTATYFYLGTVIEITVFDEDDQKHLDAIEDMILSYDLQLDRLKENSDIALLNGRHISEVKPTTYSLIEDALYYSQLTSGYFDITINPIIELWGFGTEEQQVPSDGDIKEKLAYIGYEGIHLDDGQVTLDDGTSIDLGAIAKGFIADEITVYLKENNVERALINLGGNVYALGTSTKDAPWSIGIRHPYDSGAILKINTSNRSVVTSGITERFFEEDGKTYHHIFDPYTGYPIENNLVSLTVVSTSSIQGDALSTGLFTLGIEEAFRIANMEGVEIIIITKDKEIYASEGLELEVFDDSYLIVK